MTTAAPTKAKRARPEATPAAACRNCGAALAGRFCHACGQSSADLHRSVFKLASEAVAGFFNYDARLWRTVPRLLFAPAGLTRDYLAGKRASQTSPLKLFLVILVLVFFAAGFAMGGQPSPIITRSAPATPAASAAPALGARVAVWGWYKPYLTRATQRPAALRTSLATWSQRLTFLLLPLAALLLGLLFVARRGVVMFDHVVFAMHSLTVIGLIATVVLMVGRYWPPIAWLFLLAPVHLFVHLRGAYATGVAGTLLRMAGLALGMAIGVFALLTALLVIITLDVGAAK